MTSTSTNRRQGVNAGAAIKVPCRCATTANITLSGLQSIDGVTVVADDRVLVKDQTTGSENGIYIASTSSWQRALDFDGAFDVVEGTLVPVNNGTASAETLWRVTNAGTITPGSTSLAFERALLPAASDLTYTPLGTGAIASTVSAALQLFVHTSQYSTAGNYNTARDALTGTFGVNNLDVSGDLVATGTADITGALSSGRLSVAAGTDTTDVHALSVTQTWNAVGVTFEGVLITITDTASASGSLAMQILGGAAGATSLLSLDKSGNLSTPGFAIGGVTAQPGQIRVGAGTGDGNSIDVQNGYIQLGNTGELGWSSGNPFTVALDSGLSRISAGMLGVGTGSAGSFAGSLKLTTMLVAGVTFANVPGTPATGMVINITDSNTATWGATIAGGGANNVLGRYNGANWTVVGI